MEWVKSSYSNYTNECVEVARGSRVRVRDSKDPGGLVLSFTPGQWTAFLADVSPDT